MEISEDILDLVFDVIVIGGVFRVINMELVIFALITQQANDIEIKINRFESSVVIRIDDGFDSDFQLFISAYIPVGLGPSKNVYVLC